MRKFRKFPSLVVILGILFVTGLTFTNAFRSGSNKLGVPTVLGDEEGDDEKDEIENRDSEGDNEKEEIESRDSEDAEKDNEDGDSDEEKITEVKKVRTATQRTTLQKRESDDEDGDQKENDNKDKNDLQEEFQDLTKDIGKVESRLSILSANGVVVAAFTPMLAEIKTLAVQAQTAIMAKSPEAEALFETVDHKLERLNKLVKMTLGDKDENDDDNDATEEIQDLAKKVAKIEVALNAASGRGVDVSVMKLSLNEVKDLLNQARDKVTAGDLTSAETLAEVADKKLETLKHSMELAFGDDEEDDGDEADEYKSEVASFVHNLKEIGGIEGGIGQQVSEVAQAQNATVAKVESSIDNINSRNAFMKFLIGPKYGSIAEIQTAIIENQTRIKVLSDLTNQLTDPAVKQVLQDQVAILTQQNANLQKFVIENQDGFSVFGWLAKLFS